MPRLAVLLRPRGSSDTVLLSCRPLHPPHHAPPAARRPHSTRGCAPSPPRTNCLRPHWVPGTPTPGDEQGAGPYASCTRITRQPVLHPALSGVTATLQQPQRGAEKPDASPPHVPLHLGCPNHPPNLTNTPLKPLQKVPPPLPPVSAAACSPLAPLDPENRLWFRADGDALDHAARSPPRYPGEPRSAPPSCCMAGGTALPHVLTPAALTRGHLGCFARGSNYLCAVINSKTRGPKPQLPGSFGLARGYSRPAAAEEEHEQAGCGQRLGLPSLVRALASTGQGREPWPPTGGYVPLGLARGAQANPSQVGHGQGILDGPWLGRLTEDQQN